jgi:polyketide cyclase/dehydrase/lipid transport protein
MTEVKQSIKLPAPVAEVWKKIGGFNALPDWNPAFEKSELAEGGSVRRLTIPGGGIIEERLEGSDEKTHTYSCAITDGPLPVADYHSTLRVREEGDSTVVEWEANFEPKGVPMEEASKLIQGVFQTGLDNLKKLYGG